MTFRGAIAALILTLLAPAGPALAQTPQQTPAAPPAGAAGQTQIDQSQTDQTQTGQPIFPVLVVDRQRVVTESRPARALEGTEKRMRRQVEEALEKVKSELEAEEKELTELREELDPEEFQRRTREFDRRVRLERRAAQERGARMLRFLENARSALRSALPRVLEELRRRKGAAMLVDASATLAVDPRLDMTQEAIALYDIEMGDVRFDPPSDLFGE